MNSRIRLSYSIDTFIGCRSSHFGNLRKISHEHIDVGHVVHKKVHQETKGSLTGRHLCVRPGNRRIDLFVDLCNCFSQGTVFLQMEPQDEPVMIGQPAMQRVVQLLAARLDPVVWEIGQFEGIPTPALITSATFDNC
jgi:hypothetical protein